MRTYRRASRIELGLSESTWGDLRAFLSEIQAQVRAHDGPDPITMSPPQVVEADGVDQFAPGGWTGRYPGDVLVKPDKLDDGEYERLIQELGGWGDLWNMPTARSKLPLLADEALDERNLLVPYSEALVELTESVLAHRPPVTVREELELGAAPNGPIQMARTIQERARGANTVAFTRREFSFETLPNMLLLRFHAELAAAFADLHATSQIRREQLRARAVYHQEFAERTFGEELLQRSHAIEFADPGVLDRTRTQADPEVVDLVDLWAGFLDERPMTVDHERVLDTCLKPASKLYELWVLRALVDILERVTGATVTVPEESFDRFRFGADVELRYDVALHTSSRFMNQLGVHPGRPDFALVVDGTVVWVADAKFRHRSSIETADYQRLLSYLVDLVATDRRRATVFYIGRAPHGQVIEAGGDTVDLQPFRPSFEDHQRQALEQILTEVL